MAKTFGNSERMKRENPMFNEKTRKKVGETLKKKYDSGEIIHPMQGKKRPDVVKRNLDNNPMKNPKISKKVSDKLKGKENYFKGVTGRTWKNGPPNGMLGKHHSEESKIKISKSTSGENNPFYSKHHTQKTKEKLKLKSKENGLKRYNSKEKKEEFVKKMLLSQHKRPTKPEQIMINIIKENDLPFNYTGNCQIMIGGFNPDFLSKNPKHIIEINGDYWHNLPNIIEKDKRKYETYAKYGYKTLVIWEHELKNSNQVLDKIDNFLKGGVR